MRYHVIRMAKGGQGISSETGKTFFVEGALPGESGEAVILDEKKSFGRCCAISRDNDSAYRCEDTCPASKSCDGCGFRHVRPECALELKAQAVHAEILKAAHLNDIPLRLCGLPDNALDGTRHRLRLHAAQGQVGFFARGTHTIIPAAPCAVITPELRNAVAWLQDNLPDTHDIQLDIQLDQDCETSIYAHFRIPESRVLKKYQHRPGARKNIKSAPKPSLAFLHDFAKSAIDNGPFAGIRIEEQTFGNAWIKDIVALDGIPTVSWRRIGDFGQATPDANLLLHKLVDEFLANKSYPYIVDLYAGSGNLSFRAAVRVPRVDAFEFFCDEQAFSRGVRDSSPSWQPDTRVQLNVCDLSKGLPKSALQAEAIICDPARDGLSKAIAEDICRSNAKEILYVSCEASCLARDLTLLATAFELTSLTYVDMFPQTPLVETVAYLRRKS